MATTMGTTKLERDEFSNAKAIKPTSIVESIKNIYFDIKPWYKKTWVSLLTTFILTSADFVNLKGIFEKTINGSGVLMAIVSAYILNFIAIVAVDSIKDMCYGFGTKKSNIVATICSFATFIGLFALTAWLRFAARDLTFKNAVEIQSLVLDSSSTTIDPNDPKAIALSFFLMFLPLITTVTNGLLAWISYDPVAVRLYKLEVEIAKQMTAITETEHAVYQLEDPNFIPNLIAYDEAMYSSAKSALEYDMKAFVCELNEAIMAKIHASAEDVDILSHRKNNVA